MQALLQRISNEGHTVGSHTVDHVSLDNLDTTRIEYELAGLEQTLTGLGIAAPKVGKGLGLRVWHAGHAMPVQPPLRCACELHDSPSQVLMGTCRPCAGAHADARR